MERTLHRISQINNILRSCSVPYSNFHQDNLDKINKETWYIYIWIWLTWQTLMGSIRWCRAKVVLKFKPLNITQLGNSNWALHNPAIYHKIFASPTPKYGFQWQGGGYWVSSTPPSLQGRFNWAINSLTNCATLIWGPRNGCVIKRHHHLWKPHHFS